MLLSLAPPPKKIFKNDVLIKKTQERDGLLLRKDSKEAGLASALGTLRDPD